MKPLIKFNNPSHSIVAFEHATTKGFLPNFPHINISKWNQYGYIGMQKMFRLSILRYNKNSKKKKKRKYAGA